VSNVIYARLSHVAGHPIEEQIPMMIASNIVHPKVNTWEFLHITVLEAVDLLAMDYNGKSDPYVALCMADALFVVV
jgi:hypothetical protein